MVAEGGTFRGNVYGPVATEMRLHEGVPAHAAAVLEVAIAARFLTMFVVEEHADQDTLRRRAPTL